MSFSESVKNALKALYDPGESAGGTVVSFWVALLVTVLATMGCMGIAAQMEHRKALNIMYHHLKEDCQEILADHENANHSDNSKVSHGGVKGSADAHEERDT